MSSELSQACRLCKIILSHGYSITVNDGEEDVVTRSKDMTEIRSALFSTDEDYLYVYGDDKTNHLGCIYLVYGNAPDGSEVICDHSTTQAITKIIKEFDSGLF
jgi:hypothetical protein